MKIIDQYVEILNPQISDVEILKHIEQAGRTCYLSSHKILDESYLKFYNMIYNSKHSSVLEHASFTVKWVTDRAILAEITRHRIASFCLAGDTKILRFNQNKGHLTIKELYERSIDPSRKQYNKMMTLRSMHNNLIIPNTIEEVIYSGKKEVFEVTTSLGYKIKTSKDHIYFNSTGEIKLEDLSVGDKVFVNGSDLYRDKDWFEEKYNNGLNTTDISKLCGVKPETIRKWKKIHNIGNINKYKSRVPWNKNITGTDSHMHGRVVSEETRYKSSLAKKGKYIKDINDLTSSGKRLKFSKLDKDTCDLCGGIDHLENHHIDKNIDNYLEDNKMTLCTTCHKLVHKGYNIKKVVEDTIVSIVSKGIEDTYDISMASPYHNFVANGFIVHNSVESQRYVGYSDEEGQTNEITFIRPITMNETQDYTWQEAMYSAEQFYLKLIKEGCKPQEARTVLPNSCKTTIIITANLREWMHIFDLRLSSAAYPPIIDITKKTLVQLYAKFPLVFKPLIDKYFGEK